jgi:hypothetical protein
MKNFIKPLAAVLFSVIFTTIIFLASCKKKADPTPTPTPTPTPVNYLCEGNGQSNYLPLKMGNKWSYHSVGMYDHVEEITDTVTILGKQYMKLHFTSQFDDFYYKYRMDASGNIYKFNSNDSKEYMFLPANPTVGQIIATYQSGEYLKVTGVNVTYATSGCSYTGLLKIDDNSSSNSNLATYYYKKGLGMVDEESGFGIRTYLESVTLK